MMRRFVLVLCLAVGFAGCDFMTDAATRIAYDLEREAAALRRSGETTRTFTHKPKASPEGITGPYTVRLGRALSISKYHTSYHSNFVEVPKALVVRKGEGEVFQIVLTRVGDSIQVTELR
jgi:hypothetical protein